MNFIKNIIGRLKYYYYLNKGQYIYGSTYEIISWAAANNCVSILESLKGEVLGNYIWLVASNASANGCLDVLNWWRKHIVMILEPKDDTPIHLASKCGQVAVLDWWKNSGLPLYYNAYAINYASMNGHVAVLDWWKNSGLPLKYDETAITSASEFGRVAVLDWWLNSGPNEL